jgi:ZIP family zinc transporter
MNTAVRTLQIFLADPRHARMARVGSGTVAVILVAGLGWVAIAQGGTRIDTPMGQALAGSFVAALATTLGAMIWVVSHEIIPETHRKGHEQAATLGLIGGFVVMMLLDTALG